MARPIKITEEMAEIIKVEFAESLTKGKMFDGTIKFQKTLKDDGKATITFSVPAFAKMQLLVQSFESEVAWHGVAYRSEDHPNQFYITDILVYPQLVAGATVNTDQEAYQTWLYSFDDEVFNNIRMQGHSHVNFGTTPSAVDTEHQAKILEQLDDDMFYIFMIWNKKLEHTIKIYDLQNNILYENGDITIHVASDGLDLIGFLEDSKKLCKPRYTTGGGAYGGTTYGQYNQQYQKPPVTPNSTTVANQAGKSNTPGVTNGATNNKNTTDLSVVGGASGEQIKSKPKNSSGQQPNIGKGWSGAGRSTPDYEDDYDGMGGYPYGASYR